MRKNKRPIYRQWDNPEDDTDNYLMIHPSGLMLQITFEKDFYGDKITVYQTSPMNPLSEKIFAKHKERCLKSDWDNAVRKAVAYAKGTMLFLLTKPVSPQR